MSVLLPAYCAHGTIVRAVRSILLQTLEDWEVIIVSDDRTDYLATLKGVGIEDSRISMVSTGGMGCGESVGRNRAFAESKGTFIALLDADDAYMSERLEVLLPLARRYGAATDNTGVYYREGCVAKRPFLDLSTPRTLTVTDILSPRIPLFPVFHRDYIGKGWCFSPFAADVVFNLELLCRVCGYCVVSESLYCYYKTYGSLSHSKDTVYIAERGYEFILNLLNSDVLDLTFDVRKAATVEFTENLVLNKVFGRYIESGVYGSLEEFLDHSLNGKASWVLVELEAERKRLGF